MADPHPIVGAWRVIVRIPAANAEGVNLALFGADGSVVVTFASPSPAPPGQPHRLEYYAPALGAWAPAGGLGATMTFVSLGADETGAPIGTHTITAQVEVAAGGQSWSGPFRIAVASAAGEAAGTIEGTVAATRIAASGG